MCDTIVCSVFTSHMLPMTGMDKKGKGVCKKVYYNEVDFHKLWYCVFGCAITLPERGGLGGGGRLCLLGLTTLKKSWVLPLFDMGGL